MQWEKLLSDLHYVPQENMENDGAQSDYDTIICSTLFRRLQDKAQVFPLDEDDYVRTRLTHSLEVSAIGKKLGEYVFRKLKAGRVDPWFESHTEKDFSDVLLCAGLVHDIGNPPFGHFGEYSIREWFQNHLHELQIGGIQVMNVLSKWQIDDLLCPRRKRVVLVDHNEASQSVPGLEEAEIMEIIDHHRLADIQTSNPIFVRNEPVGSTNTIIAAMFQDRGLIPSEKLAGMMAAAILSDTVMFKSPTCTVRDIRTAERMARIADISLDELGKKIFSASVEGKSAKELLYTDYKEFHIAGHDLAVAQITCVDGESMLGRKEELLTEMRAIAKKKGVSLIILMLTDVLMEGTHILYIGDDDVISQAFGVTPKENEVFLPKIMSRKKQIIPSLSALWG